MFQILSSERLRGPAKAALLGPLPPRGRCGAGPRRPGGAQTRKPAPTFRSGDPAARPGLSTACVCFFRLLHQTLVA